MAVKSKPVCLILDNGQTFQQCESIGTTSPERTRVHIT